MIPARRQPAIPAREKELPTRAIHAQLEPLMLRAVMAVSPLPLPLLPLLVAVPGNTWWLYQGIPGSSWRPYLGIQGNTWEYLGVPGGPTGEYPKIPWNTRDYLVAVPVNTRE